MKSVFNLATFAIVGTALILSTGCGSSDVITISGTVNFDGEPVKDGSVSLMPVDGKGIAGGGIITNGRYTAESSAGEMAVQINSIVEIRKDKPSKEEVERGLDVEKKQVLPTDYNRTSKLRIQVAPDKKVFNFDLTKDGKGGVK